MMVDIKVHFSSKNADNKVLFIKTGSKTNALYPKQPTKLLFDIFFSYISELKSILLKAKTRLNSITVYW